jgi:hypothetical protein
MILSSCSSTNKNIFSNQFFFTNFGLCGCFGGCGGIGLLASIAENNFDLKNKG